MSRILVIDDDEAVRESVHRILRSAGYSVQTAASGEAGLELARGGAFDVILSDLRMPGISGVDVLRHLREMRVDSSFIVMTGFGTVDTAVESMKLGAIDFVQKPFFRDELLMRVRAAAERRQLTRQVDLLQRQMRPGGTLEALVGPSPVMQKVRDAIARAAAAPGTVLITGETGTGKELAARAVHAGSTRADRPLVTLNCAALSESLLDNELFGHARGAFTGASVARPGLVEHASGGTLFLDEIGTMSSGLQAKLLRALEMGEVRRIGENATRQVDVRFVAATNLDLDGSVAAGEFRKDLYYRLNLHRVHMPPLRERPGDIHYARRAFPAPVRRLRCHGLFRRGVGAPGSGTTIPATCGSSSISCSGRSPSPAGRCSSATIFPRSCAPPGRRPSRRRGAWLPPAGAPSARWSPAPSFATMVKSAPPPGTSRSAAPPCGG